MLQRLPIALAQVKAGNSSQNVFNDIRQIIYSLYQKKKKLLGNTKAKITKDKNGKNLPHLEINEVVLIHCNIVNNDYQQDLRVSYTFVVNKAFDQLLDISPQN